MTRSTNIWLFILSHNVTVLKRFLYVSAQDNLLKAYQKRKVLGVTLALGLCIWCLCSSVIELWFSYLTCTISHAASSNYTVQLLKSLDPLLECTFPSTHPSPSAHYLWSLDETAQLCMSSSHFSPIKFSLHDILDCWWRQEEVIFPLWSFVAESKDKYSNVVAILSFNK